MDSGSGGCERVLPELRSQGARFGVSGGVRGAAGVSGGPGGSGRRLGTRGDGGTDAVEAPVEPGAWQALRVDVGRCRTSGPSADRSGPWSSVPGSERRPRPRPRYQRFAAFGCPSACSTLVCRVACHAAERELSDRTDGFPYYPESQSGRQRWSTGWGRCTKRPQ